MTDEQIVEAAYMHTVETDEPIFTFDRKELIALVRELLSAGKPAVPEGWKLVPCEPTDQMTFVGQHHRYESAWSIGAIYREMLAASPAAPAQSGEADCWAVLTPNGSRLVSPEEAKGRRDAYPLYAAPQAAQTAQLEAEIARLNAIINAPHADDFLRAVSIETEHQRQRWGAEGDAGKTPADWFWLVGYLGGKALHAHAACNTEKAEHHVITTAAALANWHLHLFGKTNMRPGIDMTPCDHNYVSGQCTKCGCIAAGE